MANFSEDYRGDFGVPGVEIEPTLVSSYDPYRGIDFPPPDGITQHYYCELYTFEQILCFWYKHNSAFHVRYFGQLLTQKYFFLPILS